MEPEIQSSPQHAPASPVTTPLTSGSEPVALPEPPISQFSIPPGPSFMQWVLIGDQGLRAGWSILVFVLLLGVIGGVAGILFSLFHLGALSGQFGVKRVLTEEAIQIVGLLGAVWVVALIARRRILDFNLTGPRPAFNFFAGLAAGFLVLSALVGAISAG